MRKPAFCICENKDADQLCGNRIADQRLVFVTQIMQSLFFLNPKFKPLAIFCCCTAWFVSDQVIQNVGFLMMRLKVHSHETRTILHTRVNGIADTVC